MEFQHAFEKHYFQKYKRTVEFTWLDIGGASDILRFIRSEFKNKPDGIGIDLFFGGGIEPYDELKREELSLPYPLPDSLLVAIPSDINGIPLYDQDFHWYAATLAGFGIMYNKLALKKLGLPEPTTWEDLMRPEVYSWVGSADPRKSGSIHATFEIILQGYGWEKGWQVIVALGANTRSFTAYGAQTPKNVSQGEVAYGLTMDSFAWAQVQTYGEEMIGFVMPSDLTIITGDGICLLKGAPNLAVAREFMNFMFSKTGQKIWILKKGEPDGPQQFDLAKFSVLPALYPEIKGRTAVQMNPFEWKSNFIYNATKGAIRWGIVNDLIGTFVIEPHRDLRNVWRRAMKAGNTDSVLKYLSQIPITEDEADSLSQGDQWRDPVFRNEKLNQWTHLVNQRYRASSKIRKLARNSFAILLIITGIGTGIYMSRRRRLYL
ncbi:extracellular solute-binding protein [candidate division KSB1 bacterium]|nr:extracellular solute-binding protein [candidate division KSB1 bacterium]